MKTSHWYPSMKSFLDALLAVASITSTPIPCSQLNINKGYSNLFIVSSSELNRLKSEIDVFLANIPALLVTKHCLYHGLAH